MGFRIRKNFNKGPFRITLSKSGIGCSIGCKGARITKKAKGGTKTTLSIPGIGINYVSETNKKKEGNKMLKKPNSYIEPTPQFVPVEVPAEWIINRLGLTASEGKLFTTAFNTFGKNSFTPRTIAEAGSPASTSIYNGLYNKNVFNKNEDKSWSVNYEFIEKIILEYQLNHQPPVPPPLKGHSAILHIFGGWIFGYIPSLYFLFSKKHYYHL